MASNGWKMVNTPAEFRAMWEAAHGSDVPVPKAYERGALFALVGYEPVVEGDTRWHISIRYGEPGVNGRIPTWDELVCAAHDLRPGVVFVVGIPPKSWWMNVHPHVLHLHETRDEQLVAMFRDNALGSPVT
jgi:hypothetical protein